MLYALSGWLQSAYPDTNWFSLEAGHLREMLDGWQGNPHLDPIHPMSAWGAYTPLVQPQCGRKLAPTLAFDTHNIMGTCSF